MKERKRTGVGKNKIKRQKCDGRDAEYARAAWDERASALGLTRKQGEVSRSWGKSSGFLSLLFTSWLPWKDSYKIWLANSLQCRPQDIWPDWKYAHITCGQINLQEYRIINYFRGLTPERQTKAETFIHCQVTEQIRHGSKRRSVERSR